MTLAAPWCASVTLSLTTFLAVRWAGARLLARRAVFSSPTPRVYQDALRRPLLVTLRPDRFVVTPAVPPAVGTVVWAGRIWLSATASLPTPADAHNLLVRAALQARERHSDVLAVLLALLPGVLGLGATGLADPAVTGVCVSSVLGGFLVGLRVSQQRADAAVARWGDPVRFCAWLEALTPPSAPGGCWGWATGLPASPARARHVRRRAMREGHNGKRVRGNTLSQDNGLVPGMPHGP